MNVLDGKGMSVRQVGAEIGRASAVKMCYASITKGTNTLHTAAMTVADALGVGETVRAEIDESLPSVMEHMRGTIPRLPADSGRWVGEMEEIARTFASAGVTPRFHQGAAEMFRLLASTPYGRETRETMDTGRTLEENRRGVSAAPADARRCRVSEAARRGFIGRRGAVHETGAAERRAVANGGAVPPPSVCRFGSG